MTELKAKILIAKTLTSLLLICAFIYSISLYWAFDYLRIVLTIIGLTFLVVDIIFEKSITFAIWSILFLYILFGKHNWIISSISSIAILTYAFTRRMHIVSRNRLGLIYFENESHDIFTLFRDRYYLFVLGFFCTITSVLIIIGVMLEMSSYLHFTKILVRAVMSTAIGRALIAFSALAFSAFIARYLSLLADESKTLHLLPVLSLRNSIEGFNYFISASLFYTIISSFIETSSLELFEPTFSFVLIALLAIFLWLLSKGPWRIEGLVVLALAVTILYSIYDTHNLSSVVKSLTGLGTHTGLDQSIASLEERARSLYEVLLLTLKYMGFLP